MNLTDAMLKTLYDRIALLETRVAQLEDQLVYNGERTHAPAPTLLPQTITPVWPPYADPTKYIR